ncbi:hypothetical protein AN3322.2 [Aspergillus nidulans FGSC A4]|jgi:hypothetical protein|uniref:Bacteriophage T5 Orf172 DNA-binding domain-containing protein n=1 Tax=Emericella nidulans (strain FGSC A4 / ATCC 38163 / CBS 112.46 / NRRL 194 / M139) TaxID=227321 RepID=Q5B808_EMENI|nr:hypothetical protein [Aspergillus nidulans FGSC A4]EAA63290.1 hypothetical protein AN3322.2 [Aspergillus nidulans FGSC A4]CBF82951.1 TPA: conserved hypothetical protein [Aspergillus nidulans FGSC A4]|eukprot:XP_660926.1 hypothetical protein AN3322.2 [Aspergillus nidulans FGSC A4]
MKSSANIDGRRIVPFAIHSTTNDSFHDVHPILNPANSEALGSLPLLSHQGQHIRNEEKAGKGVLDIKKRLNCERANCGSRTKTTGKPCKVLLKEDKIAAADAVIESLRPLTQSSPNLEDQLFELANIVHCHQHASKVLKQQRVNDWFMTFPTGDDKTIPVMSVAKKIENILWDKVSNCCIGKNKKGNRCQRKIGGQKVQNYQRTIKEIVKPDTYLDDSELDYFLQVLQHNTFCFYHVSDQGAKQVKEWKDTITNIRRKSGIPAADSNISQSGKGDSQQASTPNVHMDTSSSNILRRRSKSLSPAQFWPEEHDNTPLKIVTKPIDTADTIPYLLPETDQTKGFVYAYEVESNKGLVKIGYTSKTVGERLSEWTFDCNRVVLPIYPIDSRAAVAVPNAPFVEALCHAELRQRNVWINCDACLKRHVEWFRVSPTEAIALIRKWSNWAWMQPLPYHPSLDLALDACAEAKMEDNNAFDAKWPVEEIQVQLQAV